MKLGQAGEFKNNKTRANLCEGQKAPHGPFFNHKVGLYYPKIIIHPDGQRHADKYST